MIRNDDKRVAEVLRRVIALEAKHLNELRPRSIPEKIVQIIKDVFPTNDIDGSKGKQ